LATALLSYRHENKEHSACVRALGERLRDAGITVILDQFANEEQFNRGGPPDPSGWAGWSYTQVDVADKVLIIASAGYFRVYENREQPGVGLGAAIEAQRIFIQLFKQKGQNHRFRVVVLADGDESELPDHLLGYHRFYPNSRPDDCSDLVCWINGGSSTAMLARAAVLPSAVWPSEIPDYEPELADRIEEFTFFRSLIAGATPQRALLCEGLAIWGNQS